MGPNSQGLIQAYQLDELCISLGLANSKQEVQKLVGSRNKLNFENFLAILKEAFAKNPNGYLTDKTLFFEKGKTQQKLPEIAAEVYIGNAQNYF